jgi:hypothetical protein
MKVKMDGRDDAGQRQRHHHVGERLGPIGPVDERRVLELDGDRLEEGAEDPERVGQREGDIGQGQPEERVDEAELAGEQEERDQHDDRREHVAQQRDPRHQRPSPEGVARQAVGADHPGHEDDERRHRGHDDRVLEVRPEIRLVEELPVGAEAPTRAARRWAARRAARGSP